MASHRCASAASDHSESIAGSHEQHCSQMPQQMMFSTPSQGQPHHLSAHSHVLSQQSRAAVHQQYVTTEENMHFGQGQQMPPVCSALTGEVSVHGQLTSCVQPSSQTYSEVKSHQRRSGSHEPAPEYGNMSVPVMTMPGQMHNSPKAMHQNVEGMVVPGHIPAGDGHMPHGAYYPAPHHGQRMQNSGQISWQTQRQYMSPGGQAAAPGPAFVSGLHARFNSPVSVPFRGQHPQTQYALNQEYGDIYCQHYHPMYSEPNSSSPRSTIPPQQHCIGPNGQRIMLARHTMHPPHHRSHAPADPQFVYYAPQPGSGASQPLSSSWSGVPLGYGSQPVWHRPMAVAYGSTLPGQHMPDYHLSPEPRMTAEFCDNFGGARQRLSPLHSFSPGSVRCYRPSSHQAVHTAMTYVDEKYAGACHMLGNGNPNSTSASHEYISPVVTVAVSTATICSTVGSDVSSKDGTVLTHTVTPSHPLEHLPDARSSLLHNSCVSGTAASSLSSYNHAGYYLPGTNVSWPVSAPGEYYSYNVSSQYTQQHQNTVRHVNPYNYCASPPHAPYPGTPHYPSARCHHPYQSRAEGMHWQGPVAEHPLHDHRNVAASQHFIEQESLTAVAVTTCCGSVSIACSVLNVSSSVFSASTPVTSCKVAKHSLDSTDEVNVTITVPLQSAAAHTTFSCSTHPVKNHDNLCSSIARPLNCSPISQVVVTETGTLVTVPPPAVDSMSVVPFAGAAFSPANKDIPLVRDKQKENVVAVSTETELQNCLQVTSSALSGTCTSSKGPKRRSSRKGSKKAKKKKTDLQLDSDTGKFCVDGVIVTSAEVVEYDAAEGLCSASGNVSTATSMKMSPGQESVNHPCPVTSEQTAVVVPYGWRRHVDGGSVVYYRLHSSILLMLLLVLLTIKLTAFVMF